METRKSLDESVDLEESPQNKSGRHENSLTVNSLLQKHKFEFQEQLIANWSRIITYVAD
jgi:hypothetical protein